MNQKIFVISGLGADHTVFDNLVLPGFDLVHVTWITPDKNESLAEYAERLLPQITEQNPIVMGLSLGGMLALEISQLIPTQNIISLSSIIRHSELPLPMRIAGKLRLHRIMPLGLFSKGNRFNYWLFGAKNQADKAILNPIFNNLDQLFLKWAINALLNWGRKDHSNVSLARVHGTADLVLPKRKNSKYDIVIEGGTHLMVYNRSEEVSNAILKMLKIGRAKLVTD